MKYKLITSDKPGLFRIKALRDFGDVKAGDIGGYITNSKNLSHEGNCWVYDNSRVYSNAAVWGNAVISGNSRIHRGAYIFGDSIITKSNILGKISVLGNTKISGNVYINIKEPYARIEEGEIINLNSDRLEIRSRMDLLRNTTNSPEADRLLKRK